MPAPMAGERTRRFTRSLLRPGQAAELRHSAATAAATASGRLQQRVSAGDGEGRRAVARCEGRGREAERGNPGGMGRGPGKRRDGSRHGPAEALAGSAAQPAASACSPPLACALFSFE